MSQTSTLLALLEARRPRPMTIVEIARALDLERYDRKQLKATLESLVAANQLRRIGKSRYLWREPPPPPPSPSGNDRPSPRGRRGQTLQVEGFYSQARAGFGFVEVTGSHAARYRRDILIPVGKSGGALDGDLVRVEILRHDPRTRRTSGQVTTVVESSHEEILGTLHRRGGGWCLLPQNDRLPTVFLERGTVLSKDNEGRIARIRLLDSPREIGPLGELVDVLGDIDDPEVQFAIVVAEHGLRVDFDTQTKSEAAALPDDPTEEDWQHREDARHIPFVTIDGATARDFDDAVCTIREGSGGYRVWVAIADVAFYVRPTSALDREAALRGNSVYFPDRAIPMLPAELSSSLCSLVPERPRLVWIAEMAYDAAGRRHEKRVFRSVIVSRRRLTYDEVARFFDDGTSPFTEIDEDRPALENSLQVMHELMGKLYANRVGDGSLDLDLPESVIDLSDDGRATGVRELERHDAHRVIEELMLEANQAVAAYLEEQGRPVPYRVHEPPDPDDIVELNEFLGAFGARVDYRGEVRPQDVQKALRALAGHRLERVLTRQILRALKQAHYTTSNAGHFGLAFTSYCHFTSPIRRYPDLLAHRQLEATLAGDGARRSTPEAPRSGAGRNSDKGRQARKPVGASPTNALEDACVHSSRTEREAMLAERDMVDFKKVEFMRDHIGDVESGSIISVHKFGFFVELDRYPIQGLVRIESLEDDSYLFLEKERALKGLRTRRRLRLGDEVTVEVVDASLQRREIDLRVVVLEDATDKGPTTTRGTQRGSGTRRKR